MSKATSVTFACNMGIEGVVSKHLDRAYDAGKCKHWVKVKNPAHPAYSRVRDQISSRVTIGK
jgi:bifunctional non-homologous end joining protein LigD